MLYYFKNVIYIARVNRISHKEIHLQKISPRSTEKLVKSKIVAKLHVLYQKML